MTQATSEEPCGLPAVGSYARASFRFSRRGNTALELSVLAPFSEVIRALFSEFSISELSVSYPAPFPPDVEAQYSVKVCRFERQSGDQRSGVAELSLLAFAGYRTYVRGQATVAWQPSGLGSSRPSMGPFLSPTLIVHDSDSGELSGKVEQHG